MRRRGPFSHIFDMNSNDEPGRPGAEVLWVATHVGEDGPGPISLHRSRDEAISSIVEAIGREEIRRLFRLDDSNDAIADPRDEDLLAWWMGDPLEDSDGGLDWGSEFDNTAFVRPAVAPTQKS